LTLITKRDNELKTLIAGKPPTALREILSSVDKKSIVTVTASPALDFGTVAKILYQTRQIVADCINVEASAKSWDPYVYLLPEPNPADENVSVMPNPLLLVVILDKEGNVSLNNEKQGSLGDLEQLEKLLARIFKDRENNGVFREGRNEVEKTVFVKAAPQLKYGDVIKLVEALKDVGASPIGLQIDDL
jgi:biopolymer transport protein ExbD